MKYVESTGSNCESRSSQTSGEPKDRNSAQQPQGVEILFKILTSDVRSSNRRHVPVTTLAKYEFNDGLCKRIPPLETLHSV